MFGPRATNGSRNPLDTQGHWDWHNPLNVLPMGVVVLALVSVLVWLVRQF
jgi:hypothetical protein